MSTGTSTSSKVGVHRYSSIVSLKLESKTSLTENDITSFGYIQILLGRSELHPSSLQSWLSLGIVSFPGTDPS